MVNVNLTNVSETENSMYEFSVYLIEAHLIRWGKFIALPKTHGPRLYASHNHSPLSQSLPVNAAVQSHLKLPHTFTQVAPFLHGVLLHSSTSVRE